MIAWALRWYLAFPISYRDLALMLPDWGVAAMKRTGELSRLSRLRQCKYLNNVVEQDPQRIKRLVRPGLGFASLPCARVTLVGYEAMAMIRNGQAHNIGVGHMRVQAAFVADLFQVAT